MKTCFLILYIVKLIVLISSYQLTFYVPLKRSLAQAKSHGQTILCQRNLLRDDSLPAKPALQQGERVRDLRVGHDGNTQASLESPLNQSDQYELWVSGGKLAAGISRKQQQNNAEYIVVRK